MLLTNSLINETINSLDPFQLIYLNSLFIKNTDYKLTFKTIYNIIILLLRTKDKNTLEYYISKIRNRDFISDETEEFIYDKIRNIDHKYYNKYPEVLDNYIQYNIDNVIKMYGIIFKNSLKENNEKNITVTMTSCKRYDLFYKTVSSFLNCCEDLELIKEWIVVDDNSSEEDRKKMLNNFPFINFIFKGEKDKGHVQSMNIIKNIVTTPYIFHIEDDWKFIKKDNYLTKCLSVINSDNSYGQCLLNKTYMERENCFGVIGGIFKITDNNIPYYIHQFLEGNELEEYLKKNNFPRHCTYWPHYSFRVGLTKMSVLNEIGDFNKVNHFEMEYAYRYIKKGYKTTYLETLYCYHIGRCTFERNDNTKLNAYALNDVNQFGERLNKEQLKQDIKENIKNELKQDMKENINELKQDMKENINELKQDIKENINELKQDIKENINELKQDMKENINELKQDMKENMKENIDEKKEIYKEKLFENINESQIIYSININQEDLKIEPYPNGIKESNNSYLLKTYVLNLDRRRDRLKTFIKNNHKKLEKFNYKLFKAIDGKKINLTPKILKLFETGDYNYRRGIMGCAASHIMMWHELIISDINSMMILEDDLELAENFYDKIIISLKRLPQDYDILFLGHFTYPHVRNLDKERQNTTPIIEKWSLERCVQNSMGGTIGYIISKKGAIKMYKHIMKYGIYNAIDWVMFKTATPESFLYQNNNEDYNNIYYCNPHLVYSECVTNNIKPDSDIQYDTETTCDTIEKRLYYEINFWSNILKEYSIKNETQKDINEIVKNLKISNESSLVYTEKDILKKSKDELLSNVYFYKYDDKNHYKNIYENYKKIDLPITCYLVKDKYLISFPNSLLSNNVLIDLNLNTEQYLNVDNPI